MWQAFKRDLPGISFWLFNLVFWLFINSLATDNTYRMRLEYSKEADWFQIWLNYMPWWTMWAFVAPLVIAACKQIDFSEKRLGQFFLKNLVLTSVSLALYWSLSIIVAMIVELGEVSYASFLKVYNFWQLSLLHIDFLIFLAILCTGYTLAFYQKSKKEAIRNEQLVTQLYETELQSLRSQLNPHFLFNTLNSVTSLIRLDKKSGAIKALSELSMMLRKVLENQKTQFISLEEEIEFIRSYLTIQKIRFDEKLVTNIEVAPDCLLEEIPFMLLQPLVENAVQHGSQLESNQNQLELTIIKQNNALNISLVNKVSECEQHEGFGIGLDNCRQRLEKIYGDNFSLNLTSLKEGYFKTQLTIPLETECD